MVLCWSGNFIAAKVVFQEIPSLLAMVLRTFVSAAVIVPIYFSQRARPAVTRDRREIGILIALGLFGIVMNQFFWTMGVARTTVVHAAMIMATTPIWALLMACGAGLERMTPAKIGGMAIALAGVGILQLSKPQQISHPPTLLGDFLMLLCALTFAAMTAFGKRYKPQSGPIAVNAAGFLCGSAVLAPVLWFAGRGFDFMKVTPAAWAGLFYMGAISSVTGYLIYYYALTRMAASRIAAIQYLQPVFATMMAIAFLGETLTGTAVAAGGVIFAGVYMTERRG